MPYALSAVCLDISSAEAQLGQAHATVFMGLSMSDCGCRAGLHRISSMTQRRIQSQIMMYRTGPDRKMWSSSV